MPVSRSSSNSVAVGSKRTLGWIFGAIRCRHFESLIAASAIAFTSAGTAPSVVSMHNQQNKHELQMHLRCVMLDVAKRPLGEQS
jgi:hypothetical protein